MVCGIVGTFLAVPSLVFSAKLGFLYFAVLVLGTNALVLGNRARRHVIRGLGAYGGRRRAVAGMVLGIVGMVAPVALSLASLVPSLPWGRGRMGPRAVTFSDIHPFVVHMNQRVERLDSDLAALREQRGRDGVCLRVDSLLDEVRQGMLELVHVTRESHIYPKVESIRADYREAKRILKEAGNVPQ
jgi:hypothetical protein